MFFNFSQRDHLSIHQMDFLPPKVLEDLNSKYRPNSIKFFTFSVKKIFEDVFKTPQFQPSLLTQYSKVEKYITSEDHPITVQRNLISGLMVILLSYLNLYPSPQLQKTLSKYQKLSNQIRFQAKKEIPYSPPTEQEKEDFIPWKEVIEIRNILAKKATNLHFWEPQEIEKYTATQLKIFQKYLLMALYTYLPPLRGEEYVNTLIVSTPMNTTQNYIDPFNQKVLVINQYKTSDKYGQRIIPLPNELSKIITQIYSHYLLASQDFQNTSSFPLLPNTQKLLQGKIIPISIKNLTATLYSIFYPKQISTSMLRKIYISEILSKMPTAKKRKELAFQMGHSLEAQEFIYSRFRLNQPTTES